MGLRYMYRSLLLDESNAEHVIEIVSDIVESDLLSMEIVLSQYQSIQKVKELGEIRLYEELREIVDDRYIRLKN